MKNYYEGPYADTPRGAITVALDATKIETENYIECEFGDGLQLVPLGASDWKIDIEIFYSVTRDQYKARLRRLPFIYGDEAAEHLSK